MRLFFKYVNNYYWHNEHLLLKSLNILYYAHLYAICRYLSTQLLLFIAYLIILLYLQKAINNNNNNNKKYLYFKQYFNNKLPVY